MGVNALIMLPSDVRIDDAAEVIGILAGLKPEKQMLSGSSYACHVPGAKAEPSSMAALATITVHGDLVDGEQDHYTTWHWEPDNCTTGERLVYPKANTFWIAVGKRLVDFFGGWIAFNDLGDCSPDYTAKKPRKANNPSDGKEWYDFQDEMMNLKPITQAELHLANKVAAYKQEPVTT